MNYNPTKALVYEFLLKLSDGKPFFRGNFIVRELMGFCFLDWVEWKKDVAMKDVDLQVEEILEKWEEEDPKPTIIHYEPDGSTAQDLLGGAMEIRSPWSEGKSMNED